MPTTRPIEQSNMFFPAQTGDLQITVFPGSIFLNGVAVVTTANTTFNLAKNVTTSIYADLTTGASTSATTGFPLACYPIASVVTGASAINALSGFTDVRPSILYSGMPLVGFVTLSSTTTAVIPVAGTFNQLVGWGRVTFYGSSDTISIRFGNGTTIDSGSNYNYRWATQAAGGTTFANRDSTADSNNSLIKMAAQDTTISREINFSISNTSNKTKQMQMQAATETAGTSTLPSLDIGQGQWFNTAGQIGCFQVLTAGGATFGGSIAMYGSK
jgi:hypothetical protein